MTINLKILRLASCVISLFGILFHIGALSFTIYCMEILFPYIAGALQISRIIFATFISIYFIINALLIYGILKKVSWILKTWIVFAIFHNGLLFFAMYFNFYAQIAIIVTSLFLFLVNYVSIIIIDEFRANLNTETSPAFELNTL